MAHIELGVYVVDHDKVSPLGSVGPQDALKSFPTPLGMFHAGRDPLFDAFAVSGLYFEQGMEQPVQISTLVNMEGGDPIELGQNGVRVVFRLEEHMSKFEQLMEQAGTIFSIRVE